MSKSTIAILVISIGLNFALGGFVVGKSTAPLPVFDPTRAFVTWSQGLNEPRHKELRRAMRQHMGGHRGHMRELNRQNRVLQQALVSESFNPKQVQQALEAMRRAHLDAQEASHGAFLSFLNNLTPAERRSLAADMQSQRPSHPRPRPGPRNQPGRR